MTATFSQSPPLMGRAIFFRIAHNSGMAKYEDLIVRRNREDKELVFGDKARPEEKS